jgi:predicted nucleic acid-binding protein
LIVLDTNVVSELMRAQPDASVLRWMDAQSPSALWLNSVVVSELLYGVAKLPKGKRKEQLILSLIHI